MNKTMDPVLSNFIIMCIASSVGGVTALIGAFSACCVRSRCHHIQSCFGCIECDRSVIDESNEIYTQPAPPPNRV